MPAESDGALELVESDGSPVAVDVCVSDGVSDGVSVPLSVGVSVGLEPE